jgi:hypothetical protein
LVRLGPTFGTTLIATLIALAGSSPAHAAPSADMVIYWSSSDSGLGTRVMTLAQTRGAAALDRSPEVNPPPEAPGALIAGIKAYEELRFGDAEAAFDRALIACDHTGADGLERDQLADLHLYRALTHIQQNQNGAWDELLVTARLDLNRVLDPARFPPRAIDQFTRAQAAVRSMPRAWIRVTAPNGCLVLIDGANAPEGAVLVAMGDHWVRTSCMDHQPWGRRVTVDRDEVTIEATPAPRVPPGDDDALIQARVAGVTAVIDVQVWGGFARVRRRAISGRELERATVAMGEAGADQAVIDTVARMLTAEPVTVSRWYQSRWVWAGAGAAAVAAVLVPLMILDDRGTAPVVIRPTGFPPW